MEPSAPAAWAEDGKDRTPCGSCDAARSVTAVRRSWRYDLRLLSSLPLNKDTRGYEESLKAVFRDLNVDVKDL